MKDGKANEIEAMRKIWDEVISYEKSWIKAHTQYNIPVQKLIEYFGAQNICKMYGCSVTNEVIARELIIEAFK